MTPSELLAIAAKSVIRPGLLKNTRTYGRAERLALVPVPNESGVAPNGTASDPFYVKQDDASPKAFKSYVCDYTEGEIQYQVLGPEAQFCFTTTINGCTFSLGIPASDGSLIVSHTNMKSTKMNPQDLAARGTADQTGFQATIAQAFHGSGVLIDPTVYWTGGDYDHGSKINITVFGVKDGGWQFYYQRWTRANAVNALLDLNAFDTNSKSF